MIPFIIGILAGYLVASVFTVIGRAAGIPYLQIVNYTPLADNFRNLSAASFFSVPQFTFLGMLENGTKSLGGAVGVANVLLLFAPVALVVFAAHIADHENLSTVIGRNLIKDPGLHRTLVGDGLATMLASVFGAPANTTYGENTGVLNLTKVFDPRVIRIAAVFAILFSFSPKFAAVISAMPAATVGGVSLILYGMIASVGVRNLIESNVDFKISRNVIIAALILVLAIGIKYGAGDSINLGFTSLSGLAVAAIVGIVLNAVLPEK